MSKFCNIKFIFISDKESLYISFGSSIDKHLYSNFLSSGSTEDNTNQFDP